MFQSNGSTLQEMGGIYSFVEEIIDNLDDRGIQELSSGSVQDIDRMLSLMIDETRSILTVPTQKLDVMKLDSIEPLVNTVEETLRVTSLTYFLQSTMPDFYLDIHHLEWGNLAQMYRLLCILAARGHGKSFYFSKGYVLWRLYRYKKNLDPKALHENTVWGREGMLITNEYKLANHLLSIVKEEIEENEIFREKLYPDNRRDGWGAESIITKTGSRVTVKSVGSKMRGFHPHWIVGDDYLNDQVLYSTEQNRKYITHFHSVAMNMLEPGGDIVVVGTPFRTDDLYGDLKKHKTWKVFEYPAIYPDGRVLSPGRYTLQDILDKRETQGSTIFSREMLVRPISTESSLFPHDMLKRCYDNDLVLIPNIHSSKRKYKKLVLSADFAISANIGSDYSVFFVLGVTDNDHYDILHMWRKSGATYDEQVMTMKRIYNDFNPDVVLVEDNGMQKIFVQMLNDNSVPATGQTTTAQNKYDLHKGVPAMAALFEQGRIHLPRGDQYSRDLIDIVVGELSNFTWDEDKKRIQGVGAHDDTCMSLWIGISGTKIGSFSFSFL